MAVTEPVHYSLLEFVQSPALCGKLLRPQVKQVDGNLYLRAPATENSAAQPPLIVYAPSTEEKCSTQFATVADFHKVISEFEKNGAEIDQTPRSILQGPDLGHYELRRVPPNLPTGELIPADVRSLLGWSESESRTRGAFPLR
jgi:hypothetical protein